MLPYSNETTLSERQDLQALLAAFMCVQRETVRDMRNRIAAVSRAEQEDRPAMLQALNVTTNKSAEREIDN